eukprot:gene7518-9239_t
MKITADDIDKWVISCNKEKITEIYNYVKQSSTQVDDLEPVTEDVVTLAYNIVVASVDESAQVNDNINNQMDTPMIQQAVLLTGVTFLNLYVQLNWTGPSIKINPDLKFDKNHKEIRDLLEVDGEPFYIKAEYPLFLYLARICLLDNYSFLDSCKSSCWWSCRCMMIHQRSLSNPTPTFKALVNERFQIVSRFFVDNQDSEDRDDLSTDLAAQAKLEQSLAFHHFRQLTKLKDSLNESLDISRLSVKLIGAMGRRTKYQTFDTPQLVLEVSSKRGPVPNSTDQDIKFDSNHRFEREIENEDDTLLSRPSLSNMKLDTRNIRIIDQSIILALCLNVKNQNPSQGLTTEEMMPYIHKTLEHSNNWMVHSMGLLIRSRLESSSSKTADRAALQIQALIDQYDDPTSQGCDRMRYIYSLDYPPRWDVEREVGERYVQLGAAASAYQIFERLELWDEAIKCLAFMGKNARSEELVLQRLAVEPTPELYCILGDLKDDPAHYITGWELSKKRYSRAQRSLGRYYLARENWNQAIESFQIALSINSLFPATWFSLGCAAMRVEKWDIGLNAFSRVVALEPEDGEAWGNLASIYMYQKKLDKAYSALQEGLKQKRENWKMWENYLHVCMTLKDYQNALLSIRHIFDLAQKRLDLQILSVIANFVIQDTTDRTGINGRRIEKAVTELFIYLTSQLSNNPDLWSIYSFYQKELGHINSAIDLQQKACRSVETPGWETDQLAFDKITKFTNLLVQLIFEKEDNATNLYQIKLKIKSLLKKVETTFKDSESWNLLQSLLHQIEQKEQ